MPLLEVSGLSAGYAPGQPVIEGIDLSLDRGEIVTLVGANGAGKSTLVKSISGLLKPMTGTIRLDGNSIGALSSAARLRCGIAHVPEGRQIFAGMTVAENLDLGAYADPDTRRKTRRIEEVCTLFPILRDRLGEMAGNFSGGQQQMLAIARGLMSGPRVLLLDEPSLGVAPLLVAEIFALLRRLRDEGLGIVLAEQNARAALAIADRAYVVETGTISLSGDANELLHSPEIAERYLGVGAASSTFDADEWQTAERLRAAVW